MNRKSNSLRCVVVGALGPVSRCVIDEGSRRRAFLFLRDAAESVIDKLVALTEGINHGGLLRSGIVFVSGDFQRRVGRAGHPVDAIIGEGCYPSSLIGFLGEIARPVVSEIFLQPAGAGRSFRILNFSQAAKSS